MNYSKSKLELLKAINPLIIENYLEFNGWGKSGFSSDYATFWLFNRMSDEFEVLLPSRNSVADFALRIFELIKTVSIVKEMNEDQIFNELTSFNVDILRVKFDGLDTYDGKIPLKAGAELVNQTLSLILAAACAALKPQAVYKAKRADSVNEFIKKVKLGQTEYGSYIITAQTPLPFSNQTSIVNDGGDFFERKVIKTLAKAIESAESAAIKSVELGNIEPFVDVVNQGVSANLCEAIVGMRSDDTTAAISFDLSWSPNFIAPDNVKNHFRFDNKYIPMLEKAAKYFREKTPIQEFELKGIVTDLSNTSIEDAPGKITVLSFSEEYKMKKIKINLDTEDYKKAVNAHGSHSIISCIGTLEKTERYTYLRDYKDFVIESII